ncbi:glycosyltransferase family 2 protein [Sphingomonas sp. UV9]|uniref:glycosyltransferase family 2 protein n=1 Tax=Sphingomonas sp. UV9 TaxID=1851410 RepID=UPI001F0C7FFC|nr:glycosyltransferase family 2 protein [Sphingomonas sp. UV9]
MTETTIIFWAETVAWAVLISGVVHGLLYGLLLIVAATGFFQRTSERDSIRLVRQQDPDLPTVSIIAPAFNEVHTVVDSVRALLRQNYRDYDVIVVNDGSTDATLETLLGAFELSRRIDHTPAHPAIRAVYVSDVYGLTVIDKTNGGKGDALNAGLSVATSTLFCAIDVDSVLEPDALLRAVQPFRDDARTVAVAGTVRVGNGCPMRKGHVLHAELPSTLLPLIQTVEYLRAFLIARYAWSRLGALMIVSGAFGLFDRERVLAAGGYRTDTVGEDAELIVRLHRIGADEKQPALIRFVPEPVCWTQVPTRLRDLGTQRRRWQRGALETISLHGGMIVKARYGNAGWLGLGSMALIDVIGPALEVAGYVAAFVLAVLGAISWSIFFALFAVVSSFGFLLSAAAIALEEVEIRRFSDRSASLQLLGAAFIENFGYRQISNFWRLHGCWDHIRRHRGWGQMTRAPFAT